MYEIFLNHIRKEEGFRAEAYWDNSRWSIGYGTFSYKGEVITKEEAEDRMRVKARYIWDIDFYRLQLPEMNDSRKLAICLMLYQLGFNGVCNFKKMIKALKRNDLAVAVYEAGDSKWAKTQTPARASRIAKILAYGGIE